MVVKIGHVGPTSGAHRPPRQGQRERRPHGDRRTQRQGRDDRRQEGQVRTAGRRRRRRPEAGHRRGAEAGRRQGQRRDRPPELGHHDSGLEDLQRRRHPADLAVGDQPEVHPPGLQDHLPRRRRRRAPGRHAGQVRRQGTEGQVDRRHRRPHGLRPGRGRRVQEGRQGRRRHDRRAAVHQRQGDRLHRHPDQPSRRRSPTSSSSAAWTPWPARCCAR